MLPTNSNIWKGPDLKREPKLTTGTYLNKRNPDQQLGLRRPSPRQGGQGHPTRPLLRPHARELLGIVLTLAGERAVPIVLLSKGHFIYDVRIMF